MQESQEKDPAKKAEAQRKVQEFERKAGIVDVPEGSGNITKYDAQGNPIR
jgi:hypothetical protein